MELLERYVYDVGRRLPAKHREDIEKELKSLLMDAIDARAGGTAPTDEDVAAVLKEFGPPDEVAARYTGEKYVIGPRLYPFYRMVLWIVMGALTLGLAMSVFVGYAFEPASSGSLGSHALQFLGSLVSSVWGAIGVVTVIFWGIERGMAAKGSGKFGGAEPWDPKALPPVPKHKDAWKPADSIVAIVFTVIALVLFNALPDVIAIYTQNGAGDWQRTPVLSPAALAAYLPLWNIGWALSLALHGAVLAQGRWRLGTHLGNIAIKLYDIAVVAVMMAGPALLNTELRFPGAGNVMAILQAQFKWIFVIVIIAVAGEIIRTIVRIVRERA